MLQSIQDKIKWADTMSEASRKHKKEVEDRVEEVKKTLKVIKTNCWNANLFYFYNTIISLTINKASSIGIKVVEALRLLAYIGS